MKNKKNIEPYIKGKHILDDIMIEVDQVSMKFNLGIEKGFSLKQWFVDLGKHKKKVNNDFWALTDVDFKVKKGEVIGFIGSNGAGKSTLLKVVAGVMKPTKGHVNTYGNICPMIELGAGFDSQLTARENIYLDGAVMGYSKELIDSKFNQIVEFSELQEFLDVPVQNFSSGMVARLAFSIATIVDPEILIVDEILSVGDMAFQAKSENKMREMIGGGTTVLFVSHSVEQIRKMCDRVVWLEHGVVQKIGGKEICDDYIKYMEGK
jgi:ABC-2 type transport system ATP-binding protein